jgi:hypothetical protein
MQRDGYDRFRAGHALGLSSRRAPEPKPPQVIADGLVLHQAKVAEGRLATYLRVDLEKFDVRVLSPFYLARTTKLKLRLSARPAVSSSTIIGLRIMPRR